MYAIAHFTEIELIAWDNLSRKQHEWDNTVNYFTKLYEDRLAFQNNEAGEKPFKSAVRLKETSLPSSVLSNYSILDSTSVAQNFREAAFITYNKALENRVAVLQGFIVGNEFCLANGLHDGCTVDKSVV